METILDVLASDHRAIRALLGEVSDEASRERLVTLLVRHFVAEEQYLYPLVAQRVDGGPADSDEAFAEHRATEHELKVLERRDAALPEVAQALASVTQRFAEHTEAQENVLFPALLAACSEDELVGLADEVLGAEQLAPTRPRTVAASSPALNKFESFVEGYIDHVRDAYSHRGGFDQPNRN
jgi:iron-sulfur cluster repair protein YtfE (RIC family)